MAGMPVTEGRWVVGTDGSQRADKAVMWAARHASERALPVPLLIIHSIPNTPLPMGFPNEIVIAENQEVADKIRDHADRIIAEIAERVRQEYPSLVVETAVVNGHPAEILAQAGKDADQIIIGARGAGVPALAKMLGGVADHVVANAQGSVAVIPDQAEDRPGRPVVVGLDDSPQGRLAIARAFQAASLRQVPLVAVTAWDYGPYDAMDAQTWRHTVDEMNQLMVVEAEELLAELRSQFGDVGVTISPVRGRPEDALIEASKEAGLLVIGSTGRGGFASLLLGSTSRHVLRGSFCPVVVTRAAAGWKDRWGRSR